MPVSRSYRFVKRGFSLIGMLITMVCILVLFVLLMGSLNKAVTGQKTQQRGTVASVEDQMCLYVMYTSMFQHSLENKGQYLTPDRVAGQTDSTLNTTANLFSAMVMAQFTSPKQLISGNEYSGYVQEMVDYNFAAYNPAENRYWDSSFKADLRRLSNVSFAHMPLHGDRFERNWRSTMDPTFPILGNRGPKDGINSANSMACGRDGVWRGHMVFGDGHIDFIDTPTPNGLTFMEDGRSVQDNIFSLEDDATGADAIISFTKSMKANGPELQFD